MSAAASTTSASKTVAFALGGAALVGVGIAAGMWLNRPSAPAAAPEVAPASQTSTVDAPASAAQLVSTSPSQAAASQTTQTAQSNTAPAPVQPAPVQPAAVAEPKAAPRKPAKTKPSETTHAANEHQPAAATPPVCQTCGTVDHVRTIQKEVASTGVGAVAGGVLGGVIGNQLGKGQGKTAMTILGAIGGGVAGNQIEKQQRAETVYEVTIRMDNGTTRTITQTTPATVGTRVDVDGQQIRNLE